MQRVYKIRNLEKVKYIVYGKKILKWKYQWIADAYEADYQKKIDRQTVRYLYLKHSRKLPKSLFKGYEAPEKI